MLSTVGKQGCSRCRRALTIVELLVVISIIGVLLALLLPAVQAARESARRTQCMNRLRQIAVGMNHYVLTRNAFPTGCLGCKKEMNSWNAQILAFLEEKSLAAAYQFDEPSYAMPNRELGETVLPVFLCPSTLEERLHSGQGLWRDQAFTDYGGIYGVEGEGHDSDTDTSKHLLAEPWLGVFLFDEPVTVAQISDGLSHTVGVAERSIRRISTSEWTCGRNVFAQQKDTGLNQQSGYGNEIGSPHPDGAVVAFCDSHVVFVEEGIDQRVLNSLLTKAGGEAQ